jgi:uncharacterized protein YegL
MNKSPNVNPDIFPEHDEPRCAVVLLLDTSTSMSGEAIKELNDGVEIFIKEVSRDPKASLRVEIAIIKFGNSSASIVNNFKAVDDFDFSRLEASGITPMGAAINLGLDLLEGQKQLYRDTYLDYYQPWMILISDGYPTDKDICEGAALRIKEATGNKKLCFYAVGVRDADMDFMRDLSIYSKDSPIYLEGLDFIKLFKWLSASIVAVSHSRPGEQVTIRSYR